jgi:hypothetical protein
MQILSMMGLENMIGSHIYSKIKVILFLEAAAQYWKATN